MKFNDETWNSIKSKLNNQITNIKKIVEADNLIVVHIDQKLSDSILKVEKKNDVISLNIKRKYFSCYPDMAANFRIINKLANYKNRLQQTA